MNTPTPPDDVRRWIDRQAEPERADLARAWDLSGLAAPEAPVADADAAWAVLERRLDAEAAGTGDQISSRQRGKAGWGASPPTAPPPGLSATSVPHPSPPPVGEGSSNAAPPRPEDVVQAGLRAWQERGSTGGVATARAGAAPVRSFLLARRPALVGVALAAAAVVLAAVLWPRTTVIEAGGAVLAVALPDGSAVTLAPGSEIAYRRGLSGDERRVTLEGEGYFDVATDGRPFVVETFNAEVEVLGTEFDVLAWSGAASAETAVALVEGSVRLRPARASDTVRAGGVVLEPGEVARVAGGAVTPPVAADVAAVVAWRGGGFSVVDAPLGVVAAALEGRFGRPIGLAPGVDAGRRLTLLLPAADSADVVLRDLAAYLDLRVQAGPDRYDLLPR